MRRLDSARPFGCVLQKSRLQARFGFIGCIEAEHGDIAAEARCWQNACSRVGSAAPDFQSEEFSTRFRMSVSSAWPQVELFERVGKGLVEPHRAASRLRRPVNVAGEPGPGRLEVLRDDELLLS
jgi:hypothetical protein